MRVTIASSADGIPGVEITQLRHGEAIELATAWLDHLARHSGIRALILKGATLAQFGLRSAHNSADVDVLVEPKQFATYLAGIEALGWEEFPRTFQSDHFTHSVTLRRAGWPISLDIHTHYPGFLRPPEEVFDFLWQRRTTVLFAEHRCNTPDRVSSALILALHSLRSISEDPRHGRELAELREVEFTDSEKVQMAGVAEQTGSIAPLTSVLQDMGIDVNPEAAEFETPEYREWLWKVIGAEGSVPHATAAEWLAMISRVPWRVKPRVVFRAFWPSRHDIVVNRPGSGGSNWSVSVARAARIIRGLRALPRVFLRRQTAMRNGKHF